MDESLELKELTDVDDSLATDLSPDYSTDNLLDPWTDTAGTSPMDKHSDLLKELTNFTPIVQQRIRNWLGLAWDETEKEYKQKWPAIINMKGARWALGFLQTYQSRTNFLTNISKDEFKNLQVDIIEVACLAFPVHDNFGVKSNADWKRLITELHNTAFLVLAGAGDGKYTKFLGESVTRTESVNLTPQEHVQPRAQAASGILGTIKNKLFGR